jgi:hypothetical protein
MEQLTIYKTTDGRIFYCGTTARRCQTGLNLLKMLSDAFTSADVEEVELADEDRSDEIYFTSASMLNFIIDHKDLVRTILNSEFTITDKPVANDVNVIDKFINRGE